MMMPSQILRRWRVAPIAALAGAFLILAAGVVGALYQEHLHRVRVREDAAVRADILASSISAALIFNDRKAAQQYAQALGRNPEVEAVGIYPLSGGLFAGFARAGAAGPPRMAPVIGTGVMEGHMVVGQKVFEDGNPIGSVYLRSRTEPLKNRLARYLGIVLLGIMAAIVLAVLVTAQVMLENANRELERQAADLAVSNLKLQREMEEREKVDEALRQSHKMEAIGQLSGGIAHDFNNLLTIVKGNLQLMQRRIGQGRTDVQRYLDAATEGLNRAANLTQRILAFSRRQPLSPQPVDLAVLVREMSELLRHSVGEMVQIETRLASDCWTVCDANQMENVVLNLAINARDAMPDGGRLEIETGNGLVWAGDEDDVPAGEYVTIVIRDTGIGMSDEVRARAIDPFFTTKPQGQGTGLGLSMTFGYIQQSNGHMLIDTAPGSGTTITILMPRLDVQKGVRQAEAEIADGVAGHG